jgi:Fic family protein
MPRESLELAAIARADCSIEVDERTSTHLVICKPCLEAVAQLAREHALLTELASAARLEPAAQGARSEGAGLSAEEIPGYRLSREIHERLLQGVRGARLTPGELRRTQNWIGPGGCTLSEATFVPPPPHRLGELLGEFERAIHDDSELPSLVRVGLLHVQFETLHPYLDGNGRLGRLLITLLLRHWGLLTRPLLYLSLFLKIQRQEYYRRLSAVREEGDWEGWLAFFMEGVATVADEAVATARRLHAILGENRARLLARDDATVFSLRLFEVLPQHPILTVNRVMEFLECSRPAASKAVRVLEAAGIVRPLDDRKKNRTVVFEDYLAHLRQGTELSA